MRLFIVAIASIIVADVTKAQSLSMSLALDIGFLGGSMSMDGLSYYFPMDRVDYETFQALTTKTSKSPHHTKAGKKTGGPSVGPVLSMTKSSKNVLSMNMSMKKSGKKGSKKGSL